MLNKLSNAPPALRLFILFIVFSIPLAFYVISSLFSGWHMLLYFGVLWFCIFLSSIYLQKYSYVAAVIIGLLLALPLSGYISIGESGLHFPMLHPDQFSNTNSVANIFWPMLQPLLALVANGLIISLVKKK